MHDQLLSLLESMRASLPPTLLDTDGHARLATIAARLPVELTTFWGLESRLGEAAPRTDILFEIRDGTRGQRLLAGDPPSSLDALCADWPVWRRLRTLARAWRDPEQPFQAAIRNLWLEFDTADPALPAATLLGQPSVFIGPRRSRDALIPDLLPALQTLLEHPTPSVARLRAFLDGLPANGQLFQVGLMLARMEPGLRVCVNQMETAAIPDWLARLGWTGDAGMLADLLQTLAPRVRSLAIGLTLAEEGVGTRLGIECYLNPTRLSCDPAAWEPLLDWVADLGLCLPAKREALLAFPGITASPIRERLGPDGMVYTNLFRSLHHLKLVVAGERVSEAKAYLALNRPGMVPGAPHDAWLTE